MRKTAKQGGKLVATQTLMVSGDGRSETIQATYDAMGPDPVNLTTRFTRLVNGPKGSHLISRAWQLSEPAGTDDADVFTFMINDGTLSWSNRTGQSFVAKLDGSPAPYRGNPGITSVSVKMIDARTLEETDLNGTKTAMIARWGVDPDGRTLHVRCDDTRGTVLEQIGHKVP